MYAELLDAMADDIDEGGVVLEALSGHEDDRGPSGLALRLLSALHRIVLAGDAPGLAAYYPSAGGTWHISGGWDEARRVVREHRGRINAELDRPPQTNEVGRSAALLGGLLHLSERTGLPVRLWEIGCSAGLNLRADQFRYGYDGGRWGPAGSPVELAGAWRGPTPPVDAPLRVIERHGCDLAPLDPTTPDGELAVRSYVWPDQDERRARLDGAIEVARQLPVELQTADALDVVRSIEPRAGTTTVLWHSVMWQYLDSLTRERIRDHLDRIGTRADGPLAHLYLEPERRLPDQRHEMLVVLQTWPGGREILGTASAHGVPTTWE